MVTIHADRKSTPLMSTAYLPPLDYMGCLASASKAIIELHETYPKQTWRNRCRILTANGPLDLSIPVHRPSGSLTRTKDVLISSHDDWQVRHWRAIFTAYGNAPFFLFYKELIAPFFSERLEGPLWIFNKRLMALLLRELNLDVCLTETASYVKQPHGLHDLRSVFSPKSPAGADFLATTMPPYYQVFSDKHGFVPNLSILDLLFHLGPESGGYLAKLLKPFQDYPKEG